jgi:hypothetical protein
LLAEETEMGTGERGKKGREEFFFICFGLNQSNDLETSRDATATLVEGRG